MNIKYNNVSDYKNDLIKSISLIDECMKKIENDVAKNNNLDEAYFISKTSSGLSYLLKKLEIDSGILSKRLKITNNLIKNSNLDFSGYKNVTKFVLRELEDKLNLCLKKCRKNIYNSKKDELVNLYTEEFLIEVYMYILKNVFLESYNITCDCFEENKRIENYN
jgi:hypothetical protein